MSIGATELVECWERYRASKDGKMRERLILHYAPMVKHVVARLGITSCPALDYQDLLSHGMSGLIEAVDRFDPGRGASFETFASQRIRGSVLDALRMLDHLPRSIRRRGAEIERAIATLCASANELPSDEQIAEHLGMNLTVYRGILEQLNIAFLSLDSPMADLQRGGETMLLGEALEDTSVQDMVEQLEEQDLRRELAVAIRDLPEREQIILSLYYYEELTVREIAEVMDLSPSRVSQLLARVIMVLRARLIYNADPPATWQRTADRRAMPAGYRQR